MPIEIKRKTSATIEGDEAELRWQPPHGGVLAYAIHASEKFALRTAAKESATVFLTSEVLNGCDRLTVRAEGE